MTVVQSIALGILEGVTEFLPVSSTAHLIVAQRIFGIAQSSLFFNTVVQLGALGGLIVAERTALYAMLRDFFSLFPYIIYKKTKWNAFFSDKTVMLGIATLPVIAGGLLFSEVIDTIQDSLLPIIVMTLTIAFVLLAAEKRAGKVEKTIKLWHIILMGVSQVLALVPGTSRSGIVAATGMLLGFTRSQALEYSFLLSIPSLSLAGLYELFHVFRVESVSTTLLYTTGIATITAFFASLLVVNGLRAVVRRVGFIPFVLYRIAFGIALLTIR